MPRVASDLKNSLGSMRSAAKYRQTAKKAQQKPALRKAPAKKSGAKKPGPMKRFTALFKAKPAVHKITEADLINAESRLGATLFGPIPAGHRREFFLFEHNTWVFHESWTENGKPLESTITYEVRENGVYKLPLGGEYVKLKGAELENFKRATREYLKLVKSQLY